MKISNLRIYPRDGEAVIAADVLTGGHETALWYSVPERYADYAVTDRYDAFVIAMLPLAMRNKEDLVVKGAVSEKLFYSLACHYIRILPMANSRYGEIAIVPDSLIGSAGRLSSAGGVACGFSGGVDSLYTVKLHTSGSVPPSYRLTHLLFNNVGAHGQKDLALAHQLFEERLAILSPFAGEMGLEMVRVNSNLDQTLPGISFTETHTLRNVSVALLLQKLMSKFLYSSGVVISEQGLKGGINRRVRRYRVKRYHDFLDSQTVHLLSTESTDCILVGAEMGRIEKLEALKDYPLAQKYLNVCTSTVTNCCACKKCLQTLAILEAIGGLEKFSAVFDLQEYARHRTKNVIFDILGRPGDITYERLVNYRRRKGLSYPLPHRIAGGMIGLFRTAVDRSS
jgi:hypothetical protein